MAFIRNKTSHVEINKTPSKLDVLILFWYNFYELKQNVRTSAELTCKTLQNILCKTWDLFIYFEFN